MHIRAILCFSLLSLFLRTALLGQEARTQFEVTHRIEPSEKLSALAVSADGSKVGVLHYYVELSAKEKQSNSKLGIAMLAVWDLAKKDSVIERLDLKEGSKCDLVFAPSGDKIFVLEKTFLRPYDLKTRKFETPIAGQFMRLVGKTIVLAQAGENGRSKIEVRDLESMDLKFETDFQDLRLCDLSPDEEFMICSNGRSVSVFELASQTKRPELTMPSQVTAIAIGSGGKHTAFSTELSSSVNIEIHEWDGGSQAERLMSRLDPLVAKRCDDLRFVSDSVIAVARSNHIWFWDFQAKQEVALGSSTATESGFKTVFSKMSLSKASVATPNCFHGIDVGSKSLNVSFSKPQSKFLAYSIDEQVVAISSEDRGIEVGRLQAPKENLTLISKVVYPHAQLKNFKLSETDCMFNEDGSIVCIHGWGALGHELLGVFETASGKQMQYTPPVTPPNLVRSGVPVSYYDAEAKEFRFLSAHYVSIKQDRAKKEVLSWLHLPSTGGKATFKPAKFESPFGMRIERSSYPFKTAQGQLATVVYGVVNDANPAQTKNPLLVMELPSGKAGIVLTDNLLIVKKLENKSGPRDLAVSASGKFVALHHVETQSNGSAIDKVKTWDLETGNQVGDPMVGSLGTMFGFTEDVLFTDASAGRLNKPTVQFSDLITGRLLNSIVVPGNVVVSPRANRFLFGGVNGEVLWGNLETGETISTAPPHSQEMFRAFFSRDGKTVATIANVPNSRASDQEIRFWKTPNPAKSESTQPVILRP